MLIEGISVSVWELIDNVFEYKLPVCRDIVLGDLAPVNRFIPLSASVNIGILTVIFLT